MEILNIREHPELAESAARWFHEKWGVPLSAYEESIRDCLKKEGAVPQWYLAIEEEKIIGGLGVIENDFHDRKDLAPNVCAVYVEETHRGKGIAGAMLSYVCKDMSRLGIDVLYLATDHTDFYERYGWEFTCMAQGDGEDHLTRLYIHRQGEKTG